MVALADLAPASFRGAPFLVPRDHVEEGRNTINHLYPGSQNRYAEDNGATPPEFHLTCFLHGLDLMARWARLRAALNQPGPGTLMHPWYGAQFCAVKGPYKVVRDDKDSGVLELQICFLVTGPPVYPSLVTGIAASISTLSAKAIALSFSTFLDEVRSPTSPFSKQYVQDIIAGVGTSAAAQFGSTSSVVTAADDVQSVALP